MRPLNGGLKLYARLGVSLYLGALLCSTAQAADLARDEVKPLAVDPKQWEFAFNKEFRIMSWSGDRGNPTIYPGRGRGGQIYTPFSLDVVGRPNSDWKIELQARGGAQRSYQTTRASSGDLTSLTDTSGLATVTYQGLNGWQPFASLAINAPTGRSVAFGNRAFARMDADLVDVPTFGEGWNVGPTLGVNVQPDETQTYTFSAGTTFRSRYEREGVLDAVGVRQTQELQPSTVTTLTAGYSKKFGDLFVAVTGSYATEDATAVDGRKILRSGDRFSIGLNGTYQWNEQLGLSFAANWLHTNRNKVLDPNVSFLVREAFNSNSNVLRLASDLTYSFGSWALGPTASFLYRDKNSWNAQAFQFAPAKTRLGLGMAGSYKLADNLTINGRFEHIWTHERSNPGTAPNEALIPGLGLAPVAQRGIVASFGSTYRF